MQDGVHRSNGYAGIGSYLFHSQAAVFHNHLFHSRNHVFRSASAWPTLRRFVFTRRSAFFELLYPGTHIFHVHNAIIACLAQLLMNFDGFHATQVEESVNPYPTAFPYGNGMVLHFYQQQESSTTKTVHKVINKGLKTYV